MPVAWPWNWCGCDPGSPGISCPVFGCHATPDTTHKAHRVLEMPGIKPDDIDITLDNNVRPLLSGCWSRLRGLVTVRSELAEQPPLAS